ncbi:hypothetical protein BGZ65_008242 [Modicella reniformis]|uniref:Chitin-binding type-4 domain-containing protein n=1 Tax=Modicella reniformis TaxID=1440133 RepID=A0A9P6MEU6_9FUNG|nr:hypothetical protein BGZ65_008242 [Modicella reniformis]
MHFKRSFASIALGLLSFAALASVSQAHASLLRPCVRGSPKVDICPSSGPADYDLNSPIGTHDSKNLPLCKHTEEQGQRTIVRAGGKIETSYSVGAAHGGGHCQWALSYDKGKTWVVVKTLLRDCLKGVSNGGAYSVTVPIPKTAPNGKATFMWLWNNAIGNREIYSNCADIEIRGGSNGGKLAGMPLLIANYGSDSLYIGEFPTADQDDKSEAFNKRKAITITIPKN